jgi:hypothetical protein
MSGYIVSHVACRIALILAPAAACLMGGVRVDDVIAGRFFGKLRLLNVSVPDRVVDLGKLNYRAGKPS